MKNSCYLIAVLAILSCQPAFGQTDLLERALDATKDKISAKSLPPVTRWLNDTDGNVKARTLKALKEGPDALEALANQLQTVELKDKDGRYTTPYFHRELARAVAETDNDSGPNVIDKWRQKFPLSKSAMMAEARLCIERGWYAKQMARGVTDMDQKWKVVEAFHQKALSLLMECRDLQKTDPSWFVCYFVTIEGMDLDQSEFQKAVDELLKNFPDSSYAMSRAVLYLFPYSHGDSDNWEPWFREQVKKLPQDAAAKAYARMFFDLAELRGTNESTTFRNVNIDRSLMNKGLDLLAVEFPNRPAIATADAVISLNLFRDRKRALEAYKRANGVIDLAMLYDEDGYKWAIKTIEEVPWDPRAIGIVDINEQQIGKPAIEKRVEAAAKAGPKALEELIRRFRSEEVIDQDGVYLSTFFFRWFGQNLNSLRDERMRLEKERVIKEWQEAYPASPFPKLAAACLGISYAWDARGSSYASGVAPHQWKAFGKRLKAAQDNLIACKELQDSEPAWSQVAFILLKGAGADREAFDEVSKELFEHFPESDSPIFEAVSYLQPRWGGSNGAWEAWLQDNLKDKPEDVRARAYARALIRVGDEAFRSKEKSKELLGSRKLDIELMRKGIKLLKEKYPESTLIANGEAMLLSHYTKDIAGPYEAMKRMKGKLVLEVWQRKYNYDHAARWLCWMKSKE